MKPAVGMNTNWHEVIWSPKPVCSPTCQKTQTCIQSSFPKQSYSDGREHQQDGLYVPRYLSFLLWNLALS